jgi:hypothetical protein
MRKRFTLIEKGEFRQSKYRNLFRSEVGLGETDKILFKAFSDRRIGRLRQEALKKALILCDFTPTKEIDSPSTFSGAIKKWAKSLAVDRSDCPWPRPRAGQVIKKMEPLGHGSLLVSMPKVWSWRTENQRLG